MEKKDLNKNAILSLVSRERLAEDLWKLTNIPSPTLQEREAALAFAQMLKNAGAEVEIDETIFDSPNIIGRLKGNMPGKILQLAGHIDHIDVPHSKPERTKDMISGRGSVDMKSGLAEILEIIRILKNLDCAFSGEVLVTTYGLHEAPLGDSRGLMSLIKQEILGDSAIVFEGPRNEAVVTGKGQSIWNILLRREGEVSHELSRKAEADNLIDVSLEIAKALREKNRRLSLEGPRFPLLGSESVFIGQMHYGDFYNRAPNECMLQGTWRWHPGNSFSKVQMELHNLIEALACPENVSIKETWMFVGESFQIDDTVPIVQALKDSYKVLNGKNITTSGFSGILDTNRIVPFGNIPAIPIGYGLEVAHADHEFVIIDRLEETCRLSLLTILNYLDG